MKKHKVFIWKELDDRKPAHALVSNVDLVVVRYDENVSVLYGRCAHRGALMSDGFIRGNDIICGVHNWDYQFDTGVSSYNNEEKLPKFNSWVEEDSVFVDLDEIEAWEKENPQPYDRDAYQGVYQDFHGTAEEPYTSLIHNLAKNGLSKTGHHGPTQAMGIPGPELPRWEDIQFITAQLARLPHLDDVPVATELTIGPNAKKSLHLDIPIFVSDMSYGALSEEAKISLSK